MVIHLDVQGPSQVVFVSSCRWFVTFIDCYRRTTWVYLMHNKNEVFSYFKRFYNMISIQLMLKLRSQRDNSIEYMNGVLQGYMLEHVILHQTSCVNTPNQNVVVEQKNRHYMLPDLSCLQGIFLKPTKEMQLSKQHISLTG